MTELQIRDKAESLRHGNVAVCLENHEGQGTSRLNVSEDEFCEYVETNLGVSNGLDDTDGKREGERDTQSKQECPPSYIVSAARILITKGSTYSIL